MGLEITVDSHIRIPNLSQEWKEGLARLCAIPNEDKETALREHVWGAERMDDLLTLAEIEGDELILPRGFYNQLTDLLTENDVPYKVIQNCVFNQDDAQAPLKHPKFTDEQKQAIQQLYIHMQGRIIAPPGKGKTIIGLGAIYKHKIPTLIIVDKKHVAQQWVDRAEEHFGRKIGFIGDNKWEEEFVTVALVQTLWSRRDELDAWCKRWSMVILDEQHHIPAETFSEIIQKFPAYKRFGLSATVGKTESKKKVSELIFGPILYESKEAQLLPEVKIIPTKFDFNYYGTHKKTDGSGKTRVVRNNYQKMVTALCNDLDRNMLITNKICKEPDNAHLIISNRLSHLNALRGLCQHNGI